MVGRRSILKDKKGFEMAFSWMFAIISGAVILFLALYTTSRFIDVKKYDEAEICILVMAGTKTLNGHFCETLLPMAKSMESEARMLAAYVIYRALLESILDRKFYKAYLHAAKYLKKLDHLAAEIEDWQDLGEHGMYHVWLNQVHGKKSSFWKHYRGE